MNVICLGTAKSYNIGKKKCKILEISVIFLLLSIIRDKKYKSVNLLIML